MTGIQVLYEGPIVKRAEAKELRLTIYFTGKPCKHGHVDQRWTCSARCKTCQRKSTDRHYKENEEKYKKLSHEYNKKRWAENKEELSKKHKEWRVGNLEKRSAYMRNWRAENDDRFKSWLCEWREKNPTKYRIQNSSRRARILEADGSHTKQDIEDILKAQGNKCAEPTCGVGLSSGYHIDHIMPLSKGGANSPDNLQCLCPPCNMSKSDKHPIDWAQSKGRLL